MRLDGPKRRCRSLVPASACARRPDDRPGLARSHDLPRLRDRRHGEAAGTIRDRVRGRYLACGSGRPPRRFVRGQSACWPGDAPPRSRALMTLGRSAAGPGIGYELGPPGTSIRVHGPVIEATAASKSRRARVARRPARSRGRGPFRAAPAPHPDARVESRRGAAHCGSRAPSHARAWRPPRKGDDQRVGQRASDAGARARCAPACSWVRRRQPSLPRRPARVARAPARAPSDPQGAAAGSAESRALGLDRRGRGSRAACRHRACSQRQPRLAGLRRPGEWRP